MMITTTVTRDLSAPVRATPTGRSSPDSAVVNTPGTPRQARYEWSSGMQALGAAVA